MHGGPERSLWWRVRSGAWVWIVVAGAASVVAVSELGGDGRDRVVTADIAETRPAPEVLGATVTRPAEPTAASSPIPTSPPPETTTTTTPPSTTAPRARPAPASPRPAPPPPTTAVTTTTVAPPPTTDTAPTTEPPPTTETTTTQPAG